MMNQFWITGWIGIALYAFSVAVCANGDAEAQRAAEAVENAHSIECPEGAAAAEQCKVDKDIYIGWRTYASQCFQCHGASGLGTTFAPSLLDRFTQGLDEERFEEVVKNGFRGQVGAMPAWDGNPSVIPNIDRLYTYLRARADGSLPAGRPARSATP